MAASVKPALASSRPDSVHQSLASKDSPSQVKPLFSTQSPLHLIPPQPASLRPGLKRRRSSFPLAITPGSSSGNLFPWAIGGSQTPNSFAFEPLPSYPGSGKEGKINLADPRHQQDSGSQWISEQNSWESLLNLGDFKYTPASPSRDNNGSPKPRKMNYSLMEAGSSSRPHHNLPSRPISPGRIAQMGQDLAWKTILASMVDVESVGDVSVAKLLHEVWKRGGGDLVTNQCLWPSIIMSLTLAADGYKTEHRIPTPSAHAALALQQLYNLTLRLWEPSIFTGLLAQFASIGTSSTPASAPPPVVAASHVTFPMSETPIYGAATPTKEFDLSQWTNLTPGFDWSSILNGICPAVTDSFGDPREDLVGEQYRRSSLKLEEDQARGIDEILAAMEDGREMHERESRQMQLDSLLKESKSASPTPTSHRTPAPPAIVAKTTTQSYLPTPETDSSDSPANAPVATRQNSFTASGMGQATSPDVTACSYNSVATSSAISTISKALSTTGGNGNRAAHPTSVSIPVNSFVPPPPMCMFFNPSFKDITQGKLGVWKGELEVKGQSGGKFNILIIGEQGTENIWQAPTWGSGISYPPPAMPHQPESTFTSTMTPVSHLAREGYVPAAMAMVLCNDPDVQSFCSMVQGLHQEGVAFHLPNPRKLPLMFLPAKFDSSDGLQRLGLAYMTKAGTSAIPPLPSVSSTTAAGPAAPSSSANKEPAKKRRRRQSAPAQAAFKEAASRASVTNGDEIVAISSHATSGPRGKKRISTGLPKVEEDTEKP